MAEINDKLKALLARHNLMTGAQWQQQQQEQEHLKKSGAYEVGQCVPGEIVSDSETNKNGSFYLVRTEYPLDTQQGNVTLGDALSTVPELVALSACDDDLTEFDPARALFIDTETSGLAGGTGTVAFLVGVGYFDGDVFRLEQCFMRDFDDEEPMLHYLDTLFRRADTVVSFNGKSFDIPLLRTRFLFNRIPFRLETANHYDLVHAARRIWKLRINDCSLANVEKEVLGLHRQGDVPGSEIPQIWFDYLRTRDARDLKRVFYHHRMDILSLVSLTALLSQCLEAPEGEGLDYAEDRLSLLRLHFRQKRYEDAAAHARKLMEQETDSAIRYQCLEMWALACKRLQQWKQMEEIWELMLCEYPSDILVRFELAKHHEHRTRNLLRALEICKETVQVVEQSSMYNSSDATLWPMSELSRRIERLERKLHKCRPCRDD